MPWLGDHQDMERLIGASRDTTSRGCREEGADIGKESGRGVCGCGVLPRPAELCESEGVARVDARIPGDQADRPGQLQRLPGPVVVQVEESIKSVRPDRL